MTPALVPKPAARSHSGVRLTLACVVPHRPFGDFPASTYIRVLQPLTHPNVSGWLDVRAVRDEDAHTAPADALLVQRLAVRTLQRAERIADRCKRAGLRLVYEVDDDLFCHPPDSLSKEPAAQESMAAAKLIASAADAIVVSTDELCARLGTVFRAPVHVIPNALDERLWCAPVERSMFAVVARAARSGTLRMLYMGTTSHEGDLKLLAQPVQRLLKELGARVRLEVIGVTAAERPEPWWSAVRVPPRGAANYPGFVRWLRGLQGYAVGLAPLAATKFNDAKSQLKFLDYAGMGLAAIVSDSPPYRQIVANSCNGLLAEDSPDAWYSAMKRMLCDRKYREVVAGQAVRTLQEGHTLAAQRDIQSARWKRALGQG